MQSKVATLSLPYRKDIQELCEKPVTRDFIDKIISKKGWKQSMFTYDCALASKQFKKQADIFAKYDDSFLLHKSIIDRRNANAYLWNALGIAKLEHRYHFRFWEDRRQIWQFQASDKMTNLLKDMSSIANSLNYDIRNNGVVHPLFGTNYAII